MGFLTFAGWLHVLLFGVVVPIIVLRSKRKIDTGLELPPFEQHIVITLVQLVVFAAGSLLVASVEHIELFPARLPPPSAWLMGAVLYAAAVLVMRPRWRQTVKEGGRVLRLFMPRSGRERALWAMASTVAGLSEEITWRGVQFGLLWILARDPIVAAVLCAVMFGAAHLVQGRGASAAIVLFALAFQLLVYATGSLYVAMAVHVAYDITAGWSYGRLADELGYFSATAASPEIPGEAPDRGNQS
jgi:membrane protease YdiL (CAAX protease family)